MSIDSARTLYEQFSNTSGIRWTGRQAGTASVVLTDRVARDNLRLVEDWGIWDLPVRARVARAARECRLRLT